MSLGVMLLKYVSNIQNTYHAKEGKRKGLIANHAYTITKVVEIKSPISGVVIPLVRLRNPHGNHSEWKGDWGDE